MNATLLTDYAVHPDGRTCGRDEHGVDEWDLIVMADVVILWEGTALGKALELLEQHGIEPDELLEQHGK